MIFDKDFKWFLLIFLIGIYAAPFIDYFLDKRDKKKEGREKK